MRITGRTKITGIFGYPVEHTLSPAMHNAAFSHLGLDYCYLPFSVHPESLGNAACSIKALGMAGVNVTVPHKENIIPFLDTTDPEAAAIGAVNTVVNIDGKLSGFNTDGRGFMMSLEEEGINISDKRVLIVGAGGSARAIGYHLAKESGSLAIFNRNKEKAGNLARHISEIGKVEVLGNLDNISEYDIVINATPVGLKLDDPAPFNTDNLRHGQVICDLIYQKTSLLMQAEARGCKTISGIGMLLWQGVLAFKLWTGIKPPVEIMRTALLSEKNN